MNLNPFKDFNTDVASEAAKYVQRWCTREFPASINATVTIMVGVREGQRFGEFEALDFKLGLGSSIQLSRADDIAMQTAEITARSGGPYECWNAASQIGRYGDIVSVVVPGNYHLAREIAVAVIDRIHVIMECNAAS